MPYGELSNGLICGFAFDAEGRAEAIELDAAATRLAGGCGFVWLHFDLTDTGAEPWMRRHLALPEAFHEALRQGSRSTRLEDAQDQLVALLNDVAYEFSFDPDDIAGLTLLVRPGLAVSARRHPLRSIDRLRETVKHGARFASPMALLNHLLSDQGDVLMRIVRDATRQVDAIEDRLGSGPLAAQRRKLGALRRVLVRLQRLLAPEPGSLFRLLREPPPWVGAQDLDGLRQASEEFSLVLRDTAGLQERIKLLQEEIAAQVGEQTNRSLFTLTMVTVLALPINITAGLFGMNVGGIPLGEDTHGFAIILGLIAVFTAAAAWLAFRGRD